MTNEYIAGFFDGEGTISIKNHKKSGTFQVVATVVNTDLDILEKLKEKFGGDIYIMYRVKINHKTGYTWRVCSKMAYDFLQAIYPYTIIKKGRIELAFAFQDRIINKDGLSDKCHLTDEERLLRQGLREQMLKLNQRGIITA